MPRVRLVVAYDGTEFSGWQVQPGKRTVQGELSRLLGRLGETAVPTGAGRTDAGVHALGNVAHVDLHRAWEDAALWRALASLAPPDLRVLAARTALPAFHARYDATARTYHYALAREEDPFFRSRRYTPPGFPASARLKAELAALPGEHDMAALARTDREPRGTRCRIIAAAWTERPGGGILSVTADRFVYGMMRCLVGTLLEGAARGTEGWLARVLASRDRREAGAAVPAAGLYLGGVSYPGEEPPAVVSQVARKAGLVEVEDRE